MKQETLLEVLRQQFAEEIHEAHQECVHAGGRDLDLRELSSRLRRLMKNAAVEGLRPEEFEDLVRSTLPKLASSIDLSSSKKAG